MDSKIFIAAALVALAMAACNSDDTSTVVDQQGQGGPIAPGYQPMRPEELFAKQFKSVDVTCEAYVLDDGAPAENARPFQVDRIRVFPNNDHAVTAYGIAGGSILSNPILDIETKLSAQDVTQNGVLTSQVPTISVSGSSSFTVLSENISGTQTSSIQADLPVPSSMNSIYDESFNQDDRSALFELRCEVKTESL
jgi:hypothetical protein